MRPWVWRLNVWLSGATSLGFLGTGAYCAAHGVGCWPALAMGAFFLAVTYQLASRAR